MGIGRQGMKVKEKITKKDHTREFLKKKKACVEKKMPPPKADESDAGGFADRVSAVMFTMGDDREPLPEAVAAVESYARRVCAAILAAAGRGRESCGGVIEVADLFAARDMPRGFESLGLEHRLELFTR
jgi:hypothetical protein